MELKNEYLHVEFINQGAQMTSLKAKDGMELLHDGKVGWGQQNPTLFPIVGKLKGGNYILNDKEYAMGQHGVVRRADFEVLEETSMRIVFRFHSNAESKKAYPFDFEMLKSYELKDNEIVITHVITNESTTDMIFSIGHHPAFKCPQTESETMEDYHLAFAFDEDLRLVHIDGETGLYDGTYINKEDHGTTYKLPFDLDAYGTLVFKNLKSPFVSLVGGKHIISVSTVSHPYFGVWHTKEENFVCLEPWLSHSDNLDSDGNLEHKVGMITLAPGRSFTNTYTIKVD